MSDTELRDGLIAACDRVLEKSPYGGRITRHKWPSGESIRIDERVDCLEAESRRVTESLATLNDILLTEGKILDILVNTLADLEKGGKK